MVDVGWFANQLKDLMQKDSKTRLSPLQEIFILAFGDIGVVSTDVIATPEGYEVEVIAHVVATGGDIIFDNPTCQIFADENLLDEEVMEPYGLFPGDDLWVANFEFVFPRPNVSKIIAQFLEEPAIVKEQTHVDEI